LVLCLFVHLQVAVVKEAGLPSQGSLMCTLGSIQQELGPLMSRLSPCVVVVGQVVGLPAAWSMLQTQTAAVES
jgi:siroheme synthase